VRLFPVQLVESLWVLMTVTVGIALVLSEASAGTAFAWHVTAYGSARFVMEFARGDAPRPYWAALSGAQWTSLLLMAGVAVAGVTGVLDLRGWQVALVVTAVLVLLAVVILRHLRRVDPHRLLQARHVVELASALDLLATRDTSSSSVDVARTSRGIMLSLGRVEAVDGPVRHLTLSRAGAVLREDEARRLADLVSLMVDDRASAELVVGRPGILHLVLQG
jgi:hypothetical protein